MSPLLMPAALSKNYWMQKSGFFFLTFTSSNLITCISCFIFLTSFNYVLISKKWKTSFCLYWKVCIKECNGVYLKNGKDWIRCHVFNFGNYYFVFLNPTWWVELSFDFTHINDTFCEYDVCMFIGVISPTQPTISGTWESRCMNTW